jgi:CheY-like chemotaxis protein/anti-sigma regulatory factor (Ser/Thr protein kinase)
MSHELRSPLNGIIGFSELMYDGKAGPTSAIHKEYLGDILTSSRHLLQLINDVLDLAKVESGKMEFQSEPLNLEKVAGEVRDTLRTVAAQKQIVVRIEVDPTLSGIMADQSKLKQVLYNYLSNALKFTPNQGQVTLRFRPEDAETFRIEVDDTGIGIKAEDLGRLFTEFQQLDSSTAKKYQGTGLGLALIKRIVEAQGGHVGVRSTVDKGSIFFAVLPLVFSKTSVPTTLLVDEPNKSNGTTNSKLQSQKLLVIEDEPNDRTWLTNVLSQQGYLVESAVTGSEAILRCQEQNYRAITLDFFLPDMTGRDVLRAIRAGGRNQQTPVILLTVATDKGLVAGFKVHDILSKPLATDELFSSLEHAGVSPRMPNNKVGVVDDDASILKMLEIRLSEQGYEPICVPDGAQALEAVEIHRPHVIVLDLFMPNMDGFEVIDRLRASSVGCHVPVIVFTNKDLSAEERTRLRELTQGTAMKSGGEANLLRELATIMARPDGDSPAVVEPAVPQEMEYADAR